MDLGHLATKAVERCLTCDGRSLLHEALDVPWAVVECPWTLQHGTATLDLCRDRGVFLLVDTQAWRYRDARTFLVEKFTAMPYAPTSPISLSAPARTRSFFRADLERQASPGARALLVPGAILKSAHDDVTEMTLQFIDAAQPTALADGKSCLAFRSRPATP